MENNKIEFGNVELNENVRFIILWNWNSLFLFILLEV